MGKKLTKEEFIERAKNVHGDKYDYSLVEYINSHTKVKIICPNHGEFIQKPNSHLNKRGCLKCLNRVVSTDAFIKKAKKIHGNKYDYSLVNFINSVKKVKIICPNHGEFIQKPNDHLNYHGCPKCNQSIGEGKIESFLINNNIKYKLQKKFKNCKNKISLPFDFYLPKYNILIEYDGIQHFKPVDKFGGKNYLTQVKINDNIKNCFAHDNGYLLLRISYKEQKNIEFILNDYIKNAASA